MRRGGTLAVALGLVPLFVSGCSPPLRMCTAALDCAGPSSCVAGRCIARGAIPAIATSRRLLYDPVAVGYVRRGCHEIDRPPCGTRAPMAVALGRGDGAVAFLRFWVPLAPDVEVIEAYVLIERVDSVDADPGPIVLHLAPVLDPWDAGSLSWALQPRVEEIDLPVTRVLASGGALVRLDARGLVERWRRRRHSNADLGAAIVAQGETPTGMTFALGPAGPFDASGAASGGVAGGLGGPKLELYVR